MIKSILKKAILESKNILRSYIIKYHLDSYCTWLIKTGKFTKVYCWGGFNFAEMFDEVKRDYLSKNELENSSLVNKLMADALKSHFVYGVNPEEYFIHDFRNKTPETRATYLPKSLKDQLVLEQLGKNKDKAFIELKDKFTFYKIAGKYFNREAFSIKSKEDLHGFVSFVNRHSRFIAKPTQGRYGKNTAIYDLADYDGNVTKMFDSLLSTNNEWIIEELIKQDPRMAEWNPTSVNTIRIPSFRTKNGVQILYPFFRMGRKGSIVDNAGSGGIMVSVDPKTGVFNTDGMDEAGNIFVKNPDNGKIIKGWQVPMWGELITHAKKVHESLPTYHKYVGFDFALTPDGWVLVEGNWGDFICQQSTLRKGLRKEFEAMIND